MKIRFNRVISLVMTLALVLLLAIPQGLPVKAAEYKFEEEVVKKTIVNGGTYSIKRLEKRLYYKGNYAVTIAFEYPQLKGDTDNIKAFNKKMLKKANKAISGDLYESLKAAKIASLDDGLDEDIEYFSLTSMNLTYKKGNIYSFMSENRWWAGGVNNVSRSGINYNKRTGEYLKINYFVNGNINAKAVKKLKAKEPELATPENIKYLSNKKEFSYYVKNGKACICMQPYALKQGGDYLILGLIMKEGR